jgi:hypothetical protein
MVFCVKIPYDARIISFPSNKKWLNVLLWWSDLKIYILNCMKFCWGDEYICRTIRRWRNNIKFHFYLDICKYSLISAISLLLSYTTLKMAVCLHSGGSMLLQNVGQYLPDYMEQHLTRQPYSYALPREPSISYTVMFSTDTRNTKTGILRKFFVNVERSQTGLHEGTDRVRLSLP